MQNNYLCKAMCASRLRLILLSTNFLLVAIAFAQCPSVAITSKKSSYCISEYVELNAANVPTNARTEWNLGEGWDTATSNYSGAITSAGKVNASLRLTLNSGEICSYLALDIATVHALPEPKMDISRSLLCQGLDTVTLFDKTANSASRSWILNTTNFNNTAAVEQINAPSSGVFSITLIVNDKNGCRNVATWGSALRIYPAIAVDFTKSNTSSCYPVTTNLTSTLNLGTQTIKNYDWSLPGAYITKATTKDVTNAFYANLGNFSPKLTIETNQGCTYTAEKTNFINVGDSVQLSVSVNKTTACLSEPVTITQTKQPLPGYFIWNIASSSRSFPTKYQGNFTFRDTGYYTLNLVYNHNQCISQITQNNIVRISGLKADFKSDNAFHCEAPHTVNLVNNSDTISTAISSYKWRIIDSESKSVSFTSTSKNYSPTITKEPSAYDVELIINAASGCSDTAKKEKFIEIKPYQFDFFADPKIGCVGQDINYINKTKSASYYGLDLFSWDFLAPNKTTKIGSSASLSPVFVYNDTGHYHTQLTAANPLGCQQIKVLENAVWIVNPQLDVILEDSAFCAGENIQLRGNSTPKDENFIHSYTLQHNETGKTYPYAGDTAFINLKEIGTYDLKYNYDITGACKDTLIKKLYVNGIKGSIKLDTLSACSPIEITPSFVPEYNFHVGNNDTNFIYNWDVVPRAGAQIVGAATSKPKITLKQDRSYRIVLYVTNSTGCSYYIASAPIVTGINADISFSRDSACVGDTIFIANKSTNNPSALFWETPTIGSYVFDSIDPDNRFFVPLEIGDFDIQLIATKNNVCSDTVFKTVYVSDVKADFALLDTNLGCAPVDVVFKNKSTLADNLVWNFGDGNIRNTKNIDTLSYRYLTNSTSAGFGVSLIASSNFGCTDTLTKPGLLNLQGPLALFTITNPTGCEPIRPTITNQSTNYKNFYIDYGNGQIDTNQIRNQVYWNDSSAISKSHTVRLSLEDEFGCEAVYISPQKVIAYAYPIINLLVNPDTTLCQRQHIILEDTGFFASSWNWSINGKSISAAQKDTFQVKEPNINSLKLIAKNAFGCADTATKDLNVLESADLDFTYPEFICKDAPVTVNVTNDGVLPILYNWSFGEPGTPNNQQTTTLPNATISYRNPGNKKIIVNAEMENGCNVPDSTTISVFDSNKIPIIELASVSYDSLNHIVIQYPNFGFTYFDYFKVYRDDIFLKQEIKNTSSNIIDSTYDTTMRHCYNISITDKCGIEGKRGRAHCPIQLTGKSSVPRQVLLDWTYYVGWANVEKYEIYRKEIDSAFAYVGEVFSTQKTHIDSNNVCDKPYYYRVAAKYPGSEVRAYSNWIFVNPTVDFNPNKPNLSNVSVVGFNEIRIDWKPSTYRYTSQYLLTRAEGSKSNIVDSFYTPNLWFVDSFVSPHLYPYYYNLHDVDNCYNISGTGQYSRTIFLEGRNVDGVSKIVWDKYEQWDYPIVRHTVELLPENGRIFLDNVAGNTFEYQDNGYYPDVNGYYRYQMHSINSNGDTSYSNVAYVSGAAVYYIPNSFTPNSDGLNDEFSFFTLFVTNGNADGNPDFEVEVYNRWGQVVFYSDNINEKWDGTYKNEPAPSGVYQYRLKLKDGEKNVSNLGGILHLIR